MTTDTDRTAEAARLRAELAQAEQERPGPLGARDHAAYLGALRRAVERAAALANPTEHVDSYGRTFTLPGPFTTLASLKRRNVEAGYHFFDADTLRFFRSRIAPGVIGGRLFVTSEQFQPSHGPPEERRYTVRVMHDEGDAGTLGTFQQYRTLRAARHDAEALAAGRPVAAFEARP